MRACIKLTVNTEVWNSKSKKREIFYCYDIIAKHFNYTYAHVHTHTYIHIHTHILRSQYAIYYILTNTALTI